MCLFHYSWRSEFSDCEIQGYSEEDMMYDVMLVLKSRTEVPYATYAPGHYYGSISHLPKGDFASRGV